jgi:CRISPR system Cascade subunit CasE
LLRACPVARLVNAGNGHHGGAEVDVFLARSFSVGSNGTLSREDVYRDWLTGRLADTTVCGVHVVQVRIAALSRTRLVRRTQGAERQAKTLERPDVHFEGDLIVEDGNAFIRLLARGVGRHKAFGFGAMMVVPPGTSYPNT